MQLIALERLREADHAIADIWNHLVESAVLNHASDIHLTYQADGLHIGLRIDGEIMTQGVIPSIETGHRLTNHIKVFGEMDLAERRRPQNGRALVQVGERGVDLRISAMPTQHGQDIVIRILDRTVSLLQIDQLGLPQREMNRLMGLVLAPSGLVLVTGSTGAGKTTTLYAILNKLNDGSRKIITIENPIEYDMPGVSQSQVNTHLGVGYHLLLQNVLQQDPDVIMIGEVRDPETAATAVRAAVTGHMVFATMHATDASSAVETMLSLGAHPHFLAHALRGVIAQNLVRRICPHCTQEIEGTASILPLDDIQTLVGPSAEPSLAIGRGCEQCYQSGYLGRMGIFEIMTLNGDLRRLIKNHAPSDDIRQAAVDAGMWTMQQVGKVAAFLGQTTVEELVRTIPAEGADR